MTLNTVIYLDGPIGGRLAFDLALASICEAAGRAGDEKTAVIRDSEAKWLPLNAAGFHTVLGQGLPAITDCTYCPDGPLRPEDVVTVEDEDEYIERRCTLQLSWDTGYGYRDDQGQDCEMLHHAALRLLESRLPHGVALRWVDECTFEEHKGAPVAA